MSNFQEFVENVKAGRIEGVKYYHNEKYPLVFVGDVELQYYVDDGCFDDGYQSDHLCAHIRRWLTGKGVNWGLYADVLVMDYDHERFDQGSELDRHIDCANFVCKQGVEG